jgi:hypothetical protein
VYQIERQLGREATSIESSPECDEYWSGRGRISDVWVGPAPWSGAVRWSGWQNIDLCTGEELPYRLAYFGLVCFKLIRHSNLVRAQISEHLADCTGQ